MSLGFIYLVLALFSAAGLGISHKMADIRDCRPAAINFTLFFSASILLWGYTLFYKVAGEAITLFGPFNLTAVLVAVACGTCACFGILTFQIGVRYGRIATSWLIVNLSTLVPAILSLVIYKEWRQIGWRHAIVLALVLASVILLWRDKVIEAQRTAESEVPNTFEAVTNGTEK
ncbi:MAG: hypothetical protein ACYTBZ_23050 [Planctomycetota bacterium]|jgi:hypothetical protein